MTIEQFLPAFHRGDAIGNSTLRFHEYLIARGVDSRIVAMTIDEGLEGLAVNFQNYREDPDSIKILHFAIPSELTGFFRKIGGKKVMIYHNITPSRFFTGFSDALVHLTTEGRNQLGQLNNCFDLVIADSRYNADELDKLKFKNTMVFPIMLNLDEYAGIHSRGFQNLFRDERKNIVFVGRITPNKKIEDLIKMLFFYKKFISPSIRLMVAGKIETLPKYFYALRDLASRFLLTSDDIVFTGHIPFEELLSVYRLADVFVSMSEHEGFCLPLIESCFFQVPVVAFEAGAVPETLDGAGVLFKEKKFDVVSGLIDRVLNEPGLNNRLQELERKRIEKYRQDANPERLLTVLKAL